MGYDRPPPVIYVHAWPEAPYLVTVSAFSRRNTLVAFGPPLLSTLSLPALPKTVLCLAVFLSFPTLLSHFQLYPSFASDFVNKRNYLIAFLSCEFMYQPSHK